MESRKEGGVKTSSEQVMTSWMKRGRFAQESDGPNCASVKLRKKIDGNKYSCRYLSATNREKGESV